MEGVLFYTCDQLFTGARRGKPEGRREINL